MRTDDLLEAIAANKRLEGGDALALLDAAAAEIKRLQEREAEAGKMLVGWLIENERVKTVLQQISVTSHVSRAHEIAAAALEAMP